MFGLDLAEFVIIAVLGLLVLGAGALIFVFGRK